MVLVLEKHIIFVGIPRAIRINIAGEVQLPGTYNFSAFNTLYNALYVAGGITENASLRDIKLYRNNKLISEVDVYEFLPVICLIMLDWKMVI